MLQPYIFFSSVEGNVYEIHVHRTPADDTLSKLVKAEMEKSQSNREREKRTHRPRKWVAWHGQSFRRSLLHKCLYSREQWALCERLLDGALCSISLLCFPVSAGFTLLGGGGGGSALRWSPGAPIWSLISMWLLNSVWLNCLDIAQESASDRLWYPAGERSVRLSDLMNWLNMDLAGAVCKNIAASHYQKLDANFIANKIRGCVYIPFSNILHISKYINFYPF